MQRSASPFIRKPVVCPACSHKYEQRYFRKNMYIHTGEESDHHVIGYKWLNENVQRVHPPYFFVVMCPKCYFADIAEDFSDPFRTDFGPHRLKYFKRSAQSHDLVLDSLGGHIEYEDIDFSSALNLHYLALYQQFMPPEQLRDTYKIARLYLRIGWLFRENPSASILGSDMRQETVETPAQSSGQESRAEIHELIQVLDQFDESFKEAKRDAMHLSVALGQRLQSIDELIDPNAQNPYRHVRADFDESLAHLIDLQGQLRSLLERDAKNALNLPPKVHSSAQRDPGTFRSMYLRLRETWPMMPFNEEEAIQRALEWFHQAIETDSRLKSHEMYHQLGMLITNLRIRVNDLEGALDMVKGMYISGTDARQRYMKHLQEDKQLTSTETKKLNAKLNRLVSSVQDLVDFRDDLIGKMYQRDAGRIRELLLRTEGFTAKQRRGFLQEKGIRPEIITYMEKHGRMEAYA